MSKKSDEIINSEFLLHHRLHEAYNLWRFDLFLEELKAKNGWDTNRQEPTARDVASLYLVKKYGWTINHCRAMSNEDLILAFIDEFGNWSLPAKFRQVWTPFDQCLEKQIAASPRF